MFLPKTLKSAIELARMRDDQLQRARRYTNNNQRPVPKVETNQNVQNQESATPKRLSWEDLKRKRSLGLCFSCDERYTLGHKCRKSQLLLMEGEDADEEEAISQEEEEPEITLQALTGWDVPQTIRTPLAINKLRTVVLIDSGSTHNFVSDKMALRLNLQISPTKPFKVRVADGYPLRCNGVYRQIHTSVDGDDFTTDFYVLPLTGLDVVLGIQWLSLLGPTLCGWTAQTLEFTWAGERKRIQGLQHGQIIQAHAEELTKEAQMGQAYFAVSIQKENDDVFTVAGEMQRLLERFPGIFQPPTQLPPTREIEHNITLKEGSDPVNVRPYRYAHFQKEEIEKQVNDMLQAGLIRPSSSPFSLPVLLVKKKDGSWRFCTDYRALNNATIKDRFPIPTMEDMLDELHGASIFT